jgi:hypothetical protein
MLFVAILPITVTASDVEASYCGQSFDVAAARNRWSVARQRSVDPAPYDESCRAYGNQFFEAVKARMIPITITIADAAAPHSSLAFMFWAEGLFVFPLMLVYTAISYNVFRGKVGSASGNY